MIPVYLADDEKWVLLGLKKLIKKSGLPFQVIGEADNGLAAWDGLCSLRPKVFFTDIRMPKMSGIDLLQKIQTEQMAIQTILISGYAEFEYAQSALRGGAFDYILKPIQEEELFQILSRLASRLLPEQTLLPGEELAASIQDTIHKIVTEIQGRYTQDISLQEFADRYHISSSHLSCLLKKELGMAFSKYITYRRMELAKELLRDKGRSIDQVAQQVGYHDYFYFTKVFKESQGVSSNGRSIWDSGKVEGSQSTGIRCGASLEENTEYQWNVTVWAAEQLPHNTHRLQPAR